MKFQGLKLGESAQKTAPKWELLDAFLKKCLLYVVKVNLPSIFWAKIQPKRRFSGILGIWYGFPIGQRCSNSKERLCVCKRKKYLAQTCQKASKTLHTGMLLGWNLGKKLKKKILICCLGMLRGPRKHVVFGLKQILTLISLCLPFLTAVRLGKESFSYKDN